MTSPKAFALGAGQEQLKMTYYDELISVQELMSILPMASSQSAESSPSLLVFDVSYDLSQPHWGKEQFNQSHIAFAHFADLGHDLSAHDPSFAVNAGRHPLPNREHFAQWLGQFQLEPSTQVVVYDRNQNIFCGRLWWMLKWCGHQHVAVLDGTFEHWLKNAGATESTNQQDLGSTGEVREHSIVSRAYPLSAPLVHLKLISEVFHDLGSEHQTLIDARGQARYLGKQEPLDPVAGHIPGALNRPFNENFTPEGLFKPRAQLREEFLSLLNTRDPQTVVHQCGSGVSAVPNVLAMQLAGLGTASLYAGSWSEWSRTPGMPSESTPSGG